MLDLLSAICAKFTPETMLPFAANVVCGLVLEYHHTHKYNVACGMPYFVLQLGKCEYIESIRSIFFYFWIG